MDLEKLTKVKSIIMNEIEMHELDETGLLFYNILLNITKQLRPSHEIGATKIKINSEISLGKLCDLCNKYGVHIRECENEYYLFYSTVDEINVFDKTL